MSTKVLFIDSVHPVLQEMLKGKGIQCELNFSADREAIKNIIGDYDGVVIRSRIKMDKDMLEAAKKLKFIARAGAGMENIDVDFAEQKNIVCLNAPEGNRDAVGEHALGMILSLFNNLCRSNKEVREGKWIREGNRGIELMGKTVGVIGYGNMGSAFARRLQGFDVEVLAYDKYKKNYSDEYAKESTLETLFEKADVLSLHVPLTDETRYMVNGQFLLNFRKNIYLVNTARGKVLNTAALVKQLESGKVLGACLDVLEYEASSFENIDADQLPAPFQYLIKSDKVLLSSHIAGWTHESNIKIAQALGEKILGLLNL